MADRPPADLTDRDAPGIEIDRPAQFWKDVGAAVTSDRYAVPEPAGVDKDHLIDVIDEADACASPMWAGGHRAVEVRVDDVARLMAACYVYARHMDGIGQHDHAEKYRGHADTLRLRLKHGRPDDAEPLPDHALDFDQSDATERAN